MTVYADILITENFIAGGIILLSVNLLCSAGAPRWRITLAALFGGVYSLVIFLPASPVESVLLKIPPAFIMTLIAFSFGRLYLFLMRAGALFTVSALFGGVIYLFSVNIYPEGVMTGGGQIYVFLSPAVIIASLVIMFLIMNIVWRISGKNMSRQRKIKITYRDKSVTAAAFPDTGNKLREPLSALPVAVGKKEVVEKILPKGEVPFRVVEYSTLSGRGMMKAFKPDKVELAEKGKYIPLSPIYIGVSDGDTGPWDIILPGNYIKE